MKRARLLHCHSTFSLGGKEARAVRLMNAFGDRAEHVVLSAVPDALGARDAIDPGISVSFPGEAAPALHGKPGLSRYRELSRYMAGFDLILTYNWGAMDAVGARRVFSGACPPLVHHEDGFNADEAARLNWKRNAFRRLMLPAAARVVVPSVTLENIARYIWRQPSARIERIPNGIDTTLYAGQPDYGSIPGFERRPGEVVIGTIAGLRPVKNLPRLVRAVAPIENARLVIAGEGPEKEAVEAEAARCGMSDRLVMPGFLPAPHRYVGHFDIFALSSDSEQFPISLVEAMAAGLPAVATDVGDVRAILAESNRPFLAAPADEGAFGRALSDMAADRSLRRSIGSENGRRAHDNYGEERMIARYAQLYAGIMGRPGAFSPL